MEENNHHIPAGQITTDLHKTDDDRIYSFGGKKGISLTEIPFLRNGISLKVAGIYLLILAVNIIIWRSLGVEPNDFWKFGYIAYFGTPLGIIWLLNSRFKDSTISLAEQMQISARHAYLEADEYINNEPASPRGIYYITAELHTPPMNSDKEDK